MGCCWKEITWPNIEPCGNFNNLNNKMHTCFNAAVNFTGPGLYRASYSCVQFEQLPVSQKRRQALASNSFWFSQLDMAFEKS